MRNDRLGVSDDVREYDIPHSRPLFLLLTACSVLGLSSARRNRRRHAVAITFTRYLVSELPGFSRVNVVLQLAPFISRGASCGVVVIDS